jgi:hypothetical protein
LVTDILLGWAPLGSFSFPGEITLRFVTFGLDAANSTGFECAKEPGFTQFGCDHPLAK